MNVGTSVTVVLYGGVTRSLISTKRKSAIQFLCLVWSETNNELKVFI